MNICLSGKSRSRTLLLRQACRLVISFAFLCLLILSFTGRTAAGETPSLVTFQVPVQVTLTGAKADTPDPGEAVFHFNCYCSDPSLCPALLDNAVYTSGFGVFTKNFVFTVPSQEAFEALKGTGFFLSQFSGNADWSFDNRTFEVAWHETAEDAAFMVVPESTGPKVYLPSVEVTNTYLKEAAPVPVTFEVPVEVNISGAKDDTPDPGAAVFHFNCFCSDPFLCPALVDNAVYTNGFGKFTKNFVFTAPSQASFEALKGTGFFLSQFSGNADWSFDNRTFEVAWHETSGGAAFMVVPESTGPKVYLPALTVNNIYLKEAPAPAETKPEETKPEEPKPQETKPEESKPEETKPAETDPGKAEGSPSKAALPTSVRSGDATVITVPITVRVVQGGSDPVGPAVFHFGLEGMDPKQQFTFINDVVYTEGAGEYSGSIMFSVPNDAELEKLIKTGFDVRERSALVDGWSFAGELYHVDLQKSGNTADASVGRKRKVTSAPLSFNGLYFVNYYTRTDGKEGQAPAAMLAACDLWQEALSMKNGLYRGTVTADDPAAGHWEISWAAYKSGNAIGNASLTLRLQKDGIQHTVFADDVLRVLPEGIYLRLDTLASALKQLSGSVPEILADVPEGWTAFTQETLDGLDLDALNELIRGIWWNGSGALDEFPVEKQSGGYLVNANGNNWSDVLYSILGEAQKNHGIWYEAAKKAAVSGEMLQLAADFESAFVKLNSEHPDNALLFDNLKDALPFSLETWQGDWQKLSEESYAFKDSLVLKAGDQTSALDSIFQADAAAAVTVAAPEAGVSGAAFLEKLISLIPLPAFPGGSEVTEEPVITVTDQDYILPYSDKVPLTETDLQDLTSYDLRLARNEIYARHGRKFSSPELQAYFDAKPWYSGTIEPDAFDEAVLSPLERQNIQLIETYETVSRP